MSGAAIRSGAVKLKGNPVDLFGPAVKVGDKAPVVEVVDGSLAPVKVGGPADKVRIFSTVPSLDTAVCDLETRRFNEEAAKLPGVAIETISVDLPMAQKRWCGAAGVERVQTLSDYRNHSFGPAWGVRMASNGLLARAVFVIDANDKIRHVEYVREGTSEPDYAAAIEAARKMM